MGKIKGVRITLIEKVEVGKDPFGNAIFDVKEIAVDNVLVSPSSTDDITNQLNLTGKKAVYTLGIPKGDINAWEDREVIVFGKKYKTFGAVLEGIEGLIPLGWNRKVMVESYE